MQNPTQFESMPVADSTFPKVVGRIPLEELRQRITVSTRSRNPGKTTEFNNAALKSNSNQNQSQKKSPEEVKQTETAKINELNQAFLQMVESGYTGLIVVKFHRGSLSKHIKRYQMSDLTLSQDTKGVNNKSAVVEHLAVMDSEGLQIPSQVLIEVRS